MDKNNNLRLYNIDFLRFLFAVQIMYYHIIPSICAFCPDVDLYKNLSMQVGNTGAIIVLAFFIFSGFFLRWFKGYEKRDFCQFMQNKIISLWPMLAFSFILVLAFGHFNKYVDTLNLFFISSGVGFIKTSSSNPASWFVCVLFFLLPVFYYILKRFKKEDAIAILMLFVFCGIAMMAHSPNLRYGNSVCSALPFLTNGLVNGIWGISLGILFADLMQKVLPKFSDNSKFKRVIFTVLEGVILVYWVYYLSFHKPVGEIIYWVILFLLLFGLFLSKIGYISKILNVAFVQYLGKISYPIYLIHIPLIKVFKKYLWSSPLVEYPVLLLILSLLICIVGAILAQHIVDFILYQLKRVKTFANTEFGGGSNPL